MQRHQRWTVVAVMAVGLALTGCAETSTSETSAKAAATLVDVEGSDVEQVVLTKRAAERLDIQMEPITGQASAKTVPYAAVVYDENGDTWVYTSPKPLTFVRTSITVSDIAMDEAALSSGPDAGTEVVTVGTAELYGTEQEIGQ